jgi:hypothetical protein
LLLVLASTLIIKLRFQQFLHCCVSIRFRSKVFTAPLPSNLSLLAPCQHFVVVVVVVFYVSGHYREKYGYPEKNNRKKTTFCYLVD